MLTQKQIEKLTWSKDTKPRVGDNLYLRVRKSSKTFLYRKMSNSKVQFVTLGKHPSISLKLAKAKVADLQNQSITRTTMDQLVEKYWLEVVEPTSKVPKQVRGYLNNINITLGSTKAVAVTKLTLVEYIQGYSTERGARSADRLRSYLSQVFQYGIEAGLLDKSPMEGITRRITGYIPVSRTRILSKEELKMVLGWEHPNARVLKFLLLTGLRISESRSGYVDGDKFRMDDTKGRHPKTTKRPHWIYLTQSLKNLLPLPKSTDTNIQAWLRRLLIKKEIDPRFTPHDCRRTFSTISNEIGILPHIVEKCLNHKMEGVMAIYNHAEYEKERIECALKIEEYLVNV